MDKYQAAGLSTTEAKCYEALIKMAEAKPSELASIVNESRTNCYKILDKLVSCKLAERLEDGATLRFRASNPTQLIQLARERRAEQEQAEHKLEQHVQDLTLEYVKTHELPGVRYFIGAKEIQDIYEDQVKDSAPICFMSTTAGIDFYGFEHMNKLRKAVIQADIARWGLITDNSWAPPDVKEKDKKNRFHRTWLSKDDYTAPVEWGVYGDKLYIISFGSEAIGMTIKSPQIADAFRQVFLLLQRGQKLLPNYNDLPTLNNNTEAAAK